MYESYFDFHERPFSAAPRVDHFFPAESIESARTSLARCIERAEGVGLIVGGTGTGKSLLCQLLVQQFEPSFATALLGSGRLCTRRALLQAILFELGLPYRSLEEGELRLSLIDHLQPSEACPRGMLLIVDEAHTLPLRLLEEVRLLSNLMRGGEPRIRLVLAGGPQLEERLAGPKLAALNQRLAARGYLDSLSQRETIAYVGHQVELVGAAVGNVFTEDALVSIYRATDGVPRLINQVCDHVLVLGHAGGQRLIDAAGVDEAWADLQQLPLPTMQPEASDAPSGVIEFGGLDETGEEEGTATFEPAAVEAIDPIEQLDQVERQVAAVEEEFRPAGSIGPEVELTFSDSETSPDENLSQDENFEEEVVVDRHASLADDAGPRQPVYGREGRPAAEARDTDPSLSVVGLSEDPPHETDPAPAIPELGSPATDPVYPEPADESLVRDLFRDVAEEAGSAESGTDPIDTADLDIVEADDHDMIVIEDEPAARILPVRRREYRQLFTKLRRG